MAELQALAENLIKGQADKVKELTQAAADEGVAPGTILQDGLIAGMNVVGKKFKANEFYVPEVLIAARAMHAGMSILEPLLAKAGVQPVATVAIGTVKGDLHDIGKNIVSILLRGAGYTVKDLGNDIAPQTIVDAVREEKPQILGLSALLTSTMVHMKDTIEALKESGLRDKVKVIIGGAPVSEEFAGSIGADGCGADGFQAVAVVETLTSELKD